MYRTGRWVFAGLAILALGFLAGLARAELKPGDVLSKNNCQEAKGLLPDHVLQSFCNGDYGPTEIIEVPDSAFNYSQKFKAGSEANAGKYYVAEGGYMYETATKTWPHYWYGFPFPELNQPGYDPDKDPKVANKILYNHQVARFQVDDVYWFLAVKWATPGGFDRSVEFGAYATWFIGRHSGPIDNPDDTYLKDLIFGIAPYDVVGVATLEWWLTDPEKWQQIWVFVPTIRRVRRVTAANSGEGIMGSIIARDDVYGWGGKIQYMKWKYLGVKDMLVPISPTGIEKAMVAGPPVPKKLPSDDRLIGDKGQIPYGQVARITWNPEDQMKMGYETPGFQGKAWWPVNVKLAKRPCWVVEATPKDPYYPYGRRVIYIDRVAYWAYWTELFDRAGEYWKTILWLDKLAYTPGRNMTTRHPFWGVGMDHRQNRASFFDVQSKGYFTEYELGFPSDIYTTGNLAALSK